MADIPISRTLQIIKIFTYFPRDLWSLGEIPRGACEAPQDLADRRSCYLGSLVYYSFPQMDAFESIILFTRMTIPEMDAFVYYITYLFPWLFLFFLINSPNSCDTSSVTGYSLAGAKTRLAFGCSAEPAKPAAPRIKKKQKKHKKKAE